MRRRTAAALLAAATAAAHLAGCGPKPGEFQGFAEVQGDWGFGDVEARGICIFDGDADGDNDVLLVRTGPNLYFDNVEPGVFVERGAEVGLDTDGSGTGCAVADFDRDGDLDVVVTDNSGPTRFLVGNGGGYWADATDFFGLGGRTGQSSVTVADADADGWLDLMLTGLFEGGSCLMRNDGGVFADETAALGLDGVYRSWAAAFFDADADGLPDLYFGTDVPGPGWDDQHDFFFRNAGDFTFTDVTDDVALPNLHNAMGIAVTDVDQDGFLDFYVTNIGHHALYWNLGDGSFVDIAAATGTANNTGAAGWGTVWVDADDDGREELLVVNGGLYGDLDEVTGIIASPRQKNRFYVPHPDSAVEFPEYEDLAKRYGLDDGGAGMGAAAGDLDGDGRVDLIVASRGSSLTKVYRNLGFADDGDDGDGAAALPRATRVELRGVTSTPEGVGAVVTMEACGETLVRHRSGAPSVLSQGEAALHFATPACDEDRHVTVAWPSGAVTEHVLPPPVDGTVTVLAEDG